MKKNFLLTNSFAKRLYNKYAKDLPVIDYHNHLSVSDISSNKRFLDVYELWLKPDPYKHRLMRMMGVDEKLITGNSSNLEKFKAWCSIFPETIGTPVYSWAKMELETVFNIKETPNKDNYLYIYETANEFLKNNVITPSYLMEKFNVTLSCPCQSILDDLSFSNVKEKTVPSLRADNVIKPDKTIITALNVKTLEEYKNSIRNKLLYFKNANCVFSDLAIDNGFKYVSNVTNANELFLELCNNGKLNGNDQVLLTSHLLCFLMSEFSKLGFILQLHVGAQRFTSTRLRTLAGSAGGYAGIGNSVDINSLTTLFDDVEKTEYGLPKIVLFTLNPSDNEMISVLSGSYAKYGVKGLITQGPAWWWCDHKLGITEVLNEISNFSAIKNFIGMTTDSRSFLSFVRHDYFRRILCSFLAEKVKNNELEKNENTLKDLIYAVCYGNAFEAFKGVL